MGDNMIIERTHTFRFDITPKEAAGQIWDISESGVATFLNELAQMVYDSDQNLYTQIYDVLSDKTVKNSSLDLLTMVGKIAKELLPYDSI
jgi:hypothetical protein